VATKDTNASDSALHSWHRHNAQQNTFGHDSVTASRYMNVESKRNRLRTRYDNSPILTINNNICRTNVLMLLSDQNSQPQALTTDHETWHCIHVFLNAYRKNITSALSRDIFALVPAIFMARLDMQLIAIHNATIQKIHA
jgi:hypothetical protein